MRRGRIRRTPPPEGGGVLFPGGPALARRLRSQTPSAADGGPRRHPLASPEYIARGKIRLAAGIGRAASVREYGGTYLVHGRYLLEAAAALGARYAQMVDGTPSKEFTAKALALEQQSGMAVEFLQGDFREKELYAGLRPVDVSLLYDVLLHQENAVEVLRNVSARTRTALCVAQPCLREGLFPLPGACVNLQFYPETLKAELRSGSFWPKEGSPRRFDTTRWMWGHTHSYLRAALWGLGWRADRTAVREGSCGTYWEYRFLRFRRRN